MDKAAEKDLYVQLFRCPAASVWMVLCSRSCNNPLPVIDRASDDILFQASANRRDTYDMK